jgi:hypothetical protein
MERGTEGGYSPEAPMNFQQATRFYTTGVPSIFRRVCKQSRLIGRSMQSNIAWRYGREKTVDEQRNEVPFLPNSPVWTAKKIKGIHGKSYSPDRGKMTMTLFGNLWSSKAIKTRKAGNMLTVQVSLEGCAEPNPVTKVPVNKYAGEYAALKAKGILFGIDMNGLIAIEDAFIHDTVKDVAKAHGFI